MTKKLQGVAKDDSLLSEKIKAELTIKNDDKDVEKVIAENSAKKDKDGQGNTRNDSGNSELSFR